MYRSFFKLAKNIFSKQTFSTKAVSGFGGAATLFYLVSANNSDKIIETNPGEFLI